MKHNIAIIGPKQLIGGFKALGVHAFVAEDGDTAMETIKALRAKSKADGAEKVSYAVIILLERIARHIPEDELAKLSTGPLPAIITLPDIEVSKGAGAAKLKRLAERAVGSDILG